MAIERWERYGLLAGPVFAGMAFAGAAATGQPPTLNAPAPEIADFFESNATGIQVGAVLSAAAFLFAVMWAASFWRAMTKAEYGKPHMAVVSLAGLVFGGVFMVMASVLWSAAAMADLSPEISRFAFVLSGVLNGTGAFGLAASVLAASALSMRRDFLPKWLAVLGFMVGGLWLVGGATAGSLASWLLVPLVGAYLLWTIWLVAAAVVLFRQSSQEVDIRTTAEYSAAPRHPISAN